MLIIGLYEIGTWYYVELCFSDFQENLCLICGLVKNLAYIVSLSLGFFFFFFFGRLGWGGGGDSPSVLLSDFFLGVFGVSLSLSHENKIFKRFKRSLSLHS